MTILNSGDVGIGTTGPASKLHINGSGAGGGVCVTSDGTCSAVPAGGEISAETTLNTGADYAEYFEAEENLSEGDLVGLNANSGKVRGYRLGDYLIGLVSTDPGVIGNSKLAKNKDTVLVALVGQVPFVEDQVIVKEGKVFTHDNKPIGYLLATGNVYINLSSADEAQNRRLDEKDRQIASLKSKNEEKEKQIELLIERLDAIEKSLMKNRQ